MKIMKNATEPATFRNAESVLQALVSRLKPYGSWLVMNTTLAMSALLVYAAQSVTATKAIRDTMLAATMMDLNKTPYPKDRANRLYNAVVAARPRTVTYTGHSPQKNILL